MRCAVSYASPIAFVLAPLFVAPLESQVTLGVTGGAVRYEQVSTTSSFSVSPEARYERRGLALDASLGYTSGSDGSRAFEGGASAWAATTPFMGHVQLDGLLQGALTRPHGDSSSSSVLGLGEVAWAAEGHGVAIGMGAVHGTVNGSPAANALRTEVRGWYDLGVATVTAAIEPTRLSGSWFTEFSGGVERSVGPVDLSAGLRLRQVSGSGVTLGGQGAVSWDVTERVSAEVDAGRYLTDPYQGLPAGYFLTLGVRIKLASLGPAESGNVVGQASLGDVNLAAGQAFGFARHGNSNRTVTPLPKGSNGNSGRGNGNGHKL